MTANELADELEALPVRVQVFNLGTEDQRTGCETVVLPAQLRDNILATLRTRTAPDEIEAVARMRKALESIARNGCCDRCQEAALVARAALSGGKHGG